MTIHLNLNAQTVSKAEASKFKGLDFHLQFSQCTIAIYVI